MPKQDKILTKNLELTKALSQIDSLKTKHVELKYKYNALKTLIENVTYIDNNGNRVINPHAQEVNKIEKS